MLLEIEPVGSVRIVRMKHGEENRFSGPFVDAIYEALARMEADAGARSLVFTGSQEKFFSNGIDLGWLTTLDQESLEPFLIKWNNLLHRMFTFPKPVVAAMNGHAFAGGLFFAFSCDWRVMREDRGWLCVPEIDLGLDLPPGNVELISYIVGRRACDELSLSGRRVTAPEGLALGMVDEIAPADEVLERALEMAKTLGRKNPRQYARHKQSLRIHAARTLEIDDPPFISKFVRDRQEVGNE